ncbi:ciliary neurotrophic factor receptor subunit alpha-like [Lacerta agilis]|uniref:ciliary neurotrophic factor receptor subunit alpha-like n=1 Tax=Lacerta agilis TaxID=80427 RepID=UPI00141A1C3B|nr:ciliary neurotrophic factor receptor subunit alpha-like [Lacerta agilis]
MAYPVSAACYVVLAAVVVVYAQRHSQQESHIHYAQLGTDVALQCGSVDRDAAVTWTANSTDLDASHLNGSRLVLRNVDLSHSGQYSCYEGSSWHLKYRVNLKVGSEYMAPGSSSSCSSLYPTPSAFCSDAAAPLPPASAASPRIESSRVALRERPGKLSWPRVAQMAERPNPPPFAG